MIRLFCCFVVLTAGLPPESLAQKTLGTWTGNGPNDIFGRAVAGGGDVNGDGIPDFMIGARDGTGNAFQSGVVTVYSGADRSILFTFSGGAVGDRMGVSLDFLADTTGDGRAEMILPSYRADANGIDSGKVEVFSGTQLLFSWPGEQPFDRFGWAVCSLGDLDRDGKEEIGVGAPNHGDTRGRVYVFDGAHGLLLRTFDGESVGDLFGIALSRAGDVNGDGTEDILIGAPGPSWAWIPGKAFVYSGLDGSLLHRLVGVGPFDKLGTAVSPFRDWDGDGKDDFLLSSPVGGENFAGKVDVVSGSTGHVLFRRKGRLNFETFGATLSTAGDCNRDGYVDFLVGATAHPSPQSENGSVYLYSGRTGNLLYRWEGESPGDRLGIAVAGAGDVNGDGYDEILAGAYLNAQGGYRSGKAYLFQGHALFLNVEPKNPQTGSLLTLTIGEGLAGSLVHIESRPGRPLREVSPFLGSGYLDPMGQAVFSLAAGRRPNWIQAVTRNQRGGLVRSAWESTR